jgi:hypothetical protein
LIIDPILIGIEKFQELHIENKLKEFAKLKGETIDEFGNIIGQIEDSFESILNQFTSDMAFDYKPNTISEHDFKDISQSIDKEKSEEIHTVLTADKILNTHGYVNQLPLDTETTLKKIQGLSPEDMTKLHQFIEQIKQNKNQNFEIFKPKSFTNQHPTIGID